MFSRGVDLEGELNCNWKDDGECELKTDGDWRGERGLKGVYICWLAVFCWFSLLEGEAKLYLDLNLSFGLR